MFAKPNRFRTLLPYAAAVLMFLSIGLIWWYQRSETSLPQQQASTQYNDDVMPGGNRATITLADGRTIDLDSAASGLLAQEQGAKITKTDDGTIVYDEQQGASNTALNTISTPRGGQYKVVLPDGSAVWLNAASSLRYPTKFASNERKVELMGEAYFDVSHDAKKPFLVKSGEQTVQVLGTQFNINTYQGNVIYTTLVTGSVRINEEASGKSVTIKPNQQVTYNGRSLDVQPVSVDQYVAWRDGDFRFRETPLIDVLQQLERWYDVEVDYNNVPDAHINGVLSRNRKLSTILLSIEKTTGVKFKIEGRRLSISE